jgi:hypothetical protein
MIVEVEQPEYRNIFPEDPHPFLADGFFDINRHKVEKIVHLVSSENKSMGLMAGLLKGALQSPFSAPFGGFHFRHEKLYVGEVMDFMRSLIDFCRSHSIASFELTLPPDIYHPSLNAKLVNVLTRLGFECETPEITSWVDLTAFGGNFAKRSAREYVGQALRNQLRFEQTTERGRCEQIYELVAENRQRQGRPIHMKFEEIHRMNSLWPVDYFSVYDNKEQLVAGAIMYRQHPAIIQAVFWGDSEQGRPLRAMDFLTYRLWNHYKELKYAFIDLGISTENGIPNEGLLRFKETHDCVSSLRFRFVYNFS